MQLIHCYNNPNFPFVIAINSLSSEVFLVNSLTNQKIRIISLKKKHSFEKIFDVHQTSTFVEKSIYKQNKDFTDLREIILHFSLN